MSRSKSQDSIYNSIEMPDQISIPSYLPSATQCKDLLD